MTYESLTKGGLVKMLKAQTYKKHIVKNIEIIGQRKLVILDDVNGGNAEILKKALAQLKKKGVRVPEIAFFATNDERDLIKDDDRIRSITELQGKAKAYYVLVASSFDELEVKLKGREGKIGSAKLLAQRLEQYGYTNRDFCLMNEPAGLLGTYMKMKNSMYKVSEKSEQKKLGKLVKSTEAQMNAYKNKFAGQRCFILGYKKGVVLEELNVMLEERCIAYNGICTYFSKTPLRPSQYLLTSNEHYQGNGKYIDQLECFVASDAKVFEDKFAKRPTYINMMGDGIISQLPSFASTQSSEALRRIDDLYAALQLAIYQGFTEIYLYCFDGLYDAQLTPYDEALLKEDGQYDYPEQAQTLLKNIKTYAASAGISIYDMSNVPSLDMFEKKSFADIDFTTTKVLSKI